MSTITKIAPASLRSGGMDTEGEAPMSTDKIQPGYCLCGCGEYLGFYKRSSKRDGTTKGDPKRFARGHYASRPAPERFWPKVDKMGPNGCWVWTASKRKGYGMFHVGPGHTPAHRWSYEAANGPIPEGLVLDHLCRNRACVNPAHLEVVTSKENTLRGEGVTARKAVQTHCVRGHEFTPENTRMEGTRRKCRACAKERNRAYKARTKGGQS